jgi:hypothetical protein
MIRKRMQKLWNRYNPRRTYIDCDDELIALLSQLGYIELYRGEYFFTETGQEALMEGIKIMEAEYANVRF